MKYLLFSGADYYVLLTTFQIVSFGDSGVMPTKTVGKYIKPKDWNALISDPDTVSLHYSQIFVLLFGVYIILHAVCLMHLRCSSGRLSLMCVTCTRYA